MTADPNHYQILGVSKKATPQEIKQAYRRLVKRFHPDSQSETANHEKIVSLNSAYEVLSDSKRRRVYDQQVFAASQYVSSVGRHKRTSEAQARYRQTCHTSRQADTHLRSWFKEVYEPVNSLVWTILNSLETQIDYLAADPFDDELMGTFQDYLENCRQDLNQAQQTFRSQPNPSKVAGAAANLYYCLNQIGDGIEELHMFTLNYDEYYLNTGKELFRIAMSLRREAQEFVAN